MRRRRLIGIIRQPGRRPAHIAGDACDGDDLRQALIRVDSLNATVAEPLPPPLPPSHPRRRFAASSSGRKAAETPTTDDAFVAIVAAHPSQFFSSTPCSSVTVCASLKSVCTGPITPALLISTSMKPFSRSICAATAEMEDGGHVAFNWGEDAEA